MAQNLYNFSINDIDGNVAINIIDRKIVEILCHTCSCHNYDDTYNSNKPIHDFLY